MEVFILSLSLRHCYAAVAGTVARAHDVVAPQNQFNVRSSWEKRTELKSLHTDVMSS
jgi:hypothetical protein